jgi:hypothetical protein
MLLAVIGVGLAAVAVVVGQRSSRAADPAPNTITGTLLRELDDEPIAGAVVDLPTKDQVRTATTDGSGQFSFSLTEAELEALPVDFYLTARTPAAGAPLRSEVIAAQKSASGTVVKDQLAPLAPVRLEARDNDQRRVVPIWDGLVHLGDSNYEGTPNSRFQLPRASSTALSLTFDLPAGLDLAKIGDLAIDVIARGVECPDLLTLNGTTRELPMSPESGAAARLKLLVAASELKAAGNTLVINTATCGDTNLDDFELLSIELILSAPVAFQVSGQVRYERPVFQKQDGLGIGTRPLQVEPAPQIVVQVVNADTKQVVGSSTTDETGLFTVPVRSFNGMTAFFVRATAQIGSGGNLGSLDLHEGVVAAVHDAAGSIWSMAGARTEVGSSEIKDVELVARHANGRLAGAFAILGTAYRGFKLLASDTMRYFPRLKIVWSEKNGTDCYFQRCLAPHCERAIVLRGLATSADEYDEPVVLHELGHYAQEALSRDDTPGGPHTGVEKQDPRKAFSEGWATAFAQLVLKSPIYYDSSGSGGSLSFAFSLESYRKELDSGVAYWGLWNEFSIAALLWQLGGKQAADQAPALIRVLERDVQQSIGFSTLLPMISGLRNELDPATLSAALQAESISVDLDESGSEAMSPSTGDGGHCRRAVYQQAADLPYRHEGIVDLDYGRPASAAVDVTGLYCWNPLYFVEIDQPMVVRLVPQKDCDLNFRVFRVGDRTTKMVGFGYNEGAGVAEETRVQAPGLAERRVLIVDGTRGPKSPRRCSYTLSLEAVPQ